jgi:hypothetical protein
LDREVSEKGKDIKETLVVGDQNVAFPGIYVFQSLNGYPCARRPNLDFSPETGDAMGNVFRRIEERKENGHHSQNHRG